MEKKDNLKSLQMKLETLNLELPFALEIKEALKANSDVIKTKILKFEIARATRYIHQGQGYYSCALPDGKHYFDLNPNEYSLFKELYDKKLDDYRNIKSCIEKISNKEQFADDCEGEKEE